MNTPETAAPESMTDNGPGNQKAGPFDVFGHYELMWWPYRSLSKALLRTHGNLTAFMTVNRKLADEMREIIRKEQDLVLQISEKMLHRAASARDDGGVESFNRVGEIEDLYDSAVAGIRELGKAVADAQVRSIESLRAHARSAMSPPDEPSKAA